MKFLGPFCFLGFGFLSVDVGLHEGCSASKTMVFLVGFLVLA